MAFYLHVFASFKFTSIEIKLSITHWWPYYFLLSNFYTDKNNYSQKFHHIFKAISVKAFVEMISVSS